MQRAIPFEVHCNTLEIYKQLGLTFGEGEEGTYSAYSQATKKLKDALSLTATESRILSYYVHGWSAKEIGKPMRSSHRTVERHVANIMKKCAVHARADLIGLVFVKGLHVDLRTIFDAELASSAQID